MALNNYFLSYDINRPHPTHAEIDEHIRKLGANSVHRVLETVWYVRSNLSREQLYNYVNSKLTNNDGVLIIQAEQAYWRNLLVPNETLQQCWYASAQAAAHHNEW